MGSEGQGCQGGCPQDPRSPQRGKRALTRGSRLFTLSSSLLPTSGLLTFILLGPLYFLGSTLALVDRNMLFVDLLPDFLFN